MNDNDEPISKFPCKQHCEFIPLQYSRVLIMSLVVIPSTPAHVYTMDSAACSVCMEMHVFIGPLKESQLMREEVQFNWQALGSECYQGVLLSTQQKSRQAEQWSSETNNSNHSTSPVYLRSYILVCLSQRCYKGNLIQIKMTETRCTAWWIEVVSRVQSY